MSRDKFTRTVAALTISSLTLSIVDTPSASAVSGSGSSSGIVFQEPGPLSSGSSMDGAFVNATKPATGGPQRNESAPVPDDDEVPATIVPHPETNSIDYVVDREDLQATVTTHFHRDDTISVAIHGVSEGNPFSETFSVESFALTGSEPDDFIATLRAQNSGQTIQLNGENATTQAFPALVVLGALARFGLKYAIRWYGKTQVKKAAKSYLLNNLKPNKWSHILRKQHCWGDKLKAHSKEQVAELMARAMAEGNHVPHGHGSNKAVWKHAGETIEVTYHTGSGKISDGWVKGYCK